MHSLLTAFADYAFFKYVKTTYNHEIAQKAIMCRLLSWFSFYVSPRSLTNNIEEVLTVFMLAAYPSENDKNQNLKIFTKKSYWLFHMVSFISFSIRATAAINLAPIYVYFFLKSKSKLQFFQEFLIIGYIWCLQIFDLSQFIKRKYLFDHFQNICFIDKYSSG